VRALGRRSREAVPPVLERHGLRWTRLGSRSPETGGRVRLGRKEFGVLEELLRADGAVVSAERLLEKVWDENVDPFANVVRVTVMSLRRKLGHPPLIHTVVAAGYRIAGGSQCPRGGRVRVRLTVLYGLSFLTAGAVLVAVT
jgi:DNA-binding response OmpR family regulator